jgi:N-methylhydantoinase B
MEIGTLDGAPFTLFAAFDRIAHPARGRAGGAPGAPGELRLRNGGVLAGKGAHEISPDDRLIVRTPGGGGYGPSASRTDEARAVDRSAGYLGIEQ